MGLLFKFGQAVPEIFRPGHEYITAELEMTLFWQKTLLKTEKDS